MEFDLEKKQALPHISIRTMEEGDLEAVAELEQACFTEPWSKAQISECLKHPYDQVWILETEGKIAGYCNFRVIAGEGELMRIAVAPFFRGRGYSRRLMGILTQDARKNQVEAVTLEVRASNHPAINLYKSYGFKIESVRKDYYRLPKEDALIMWNRQV